MASRQPTLTDQHAAVLTSVCKSCQDTHELIQKAQAAGLDMSEYHQQNQAQLLLATKLKASFFPQSP
jgi:hypothetical protein